MRTIWMCALAAGMLAGLTMTPQAKAQGECKGVVAIDSVYQNSTSQGKFEYMVMVRNEKSGPSAVTLEFGSFPKDVSLFSRTLPKVTLRAHEQKTIRFGSGSNGDINMHTVKVYYDYAMSLPAPYVLASHCSTIVTK